MTTMGRTAPAGEDARAETIRSLHELIAALDRRVPHVERAGEVGIARAADALRSDAVRRIAELEREAATAPPPVDGRAGSLP